MVYLCTNRVAAPHDGLELGVGDSILLKARMVAALRSVV